MNNCLTVSIVLVDKDCKNKLQKIQDNEYNLSELEDELRAVDYGINDIDAYDKSILRIKRYADSLQTLNIKGDD
jgi:hypothetical protein